MIADIEREPCSVTPATCAALNLQTGGEKRKKKGEEVQFMILHFSEHSRREK